MGNFPSEEQYDAEAQQQGYNNVDGTTGEQKRPHSTSLSVINKQNN